jgi:putative endopeptidase
VSSNDHDLRSGLDLRWVDQQTRPQDDLYTHVNGRWLRSTTIPPDRAQHGTLHVVRDETEADVRAIIEELADPSSGDGRVQLDADDLRVGRLYRSFLDTEKLAALGTTPLLALLTEIDAASDSAGLAQVLGARQREALAGLFWVWVAPDARDTSRSLPHLSQGGLGLPDEAYYREDAHATTREAYREHLTRMATLVGLAAPEEAARQAYSLETELAAASSDAVSARDAEQTYTLMSWTELTEHAPEFDWRPWLTGLGASESVFEQVVVTQPEFLAGAAHLWRRQPLAQWKAWLSLRLVCACAPYLSDEIVAADFEFTGRTLSGAPQLSPRWRRGIALVETALGDALGRRYVERHFPASSQDRALALVDNLVKAYRASLSRVDWMSSQTRDRALEKLDSFSAKVGFPDRWKDYSGLDIRADDLMGNVQRVGRWRTEYELNKIGIPVDRDEWLTTPQTVNAFYNPRFNEVVFPAAVLRPPLFDPDADDAANYGGIGATIGHEIGHGFDDQGSKYDGHGNLVDWWQAEDRERFTERAEALVAQYDGLHPAGLGPEHTVNGALTLGENIGDLGGLTVAVMAYQLSVAQSGAQQAPVIDGLTGLQRVFFAWALTWRAVTREPEAIRRLATDPHAPPDLRCNAVVTNLDTFHDAFAVTESDALFTPESQRIRIW